MNSKMRTDVSKLCKAEKIVLSQYQCDRALHILNHDMKIVDGKVVMIERDVQKDPAVEVNHDDQGGAGSAPAKKDKVLVTLEKMVAKMDDQAEQIKALSEKAEVQSKMTKEQSKIIEDLEQRDHRAAKESRKTDEKDRPASKKD